MKLSNPLFKPNDQKPHSLLDRRYAERVPIRYRVAYSGAEGARIVRGEGILTNLSKTGCKTEVEPSESECEVGEKGQSCTRKKGFRASQRKRAERINRQNWQCQRWKQCV